MLTNQLNHPTNDMHPVDQHVQHKTTCILYQLQIKDILDLRPNQDLFSAASQPIRVSRAETQIISHTQISPPLTPPNQHVNVSHPRI